MRILKRTIQILLTLFVLLVLILVFRVRDKNPGYKLQLEILSKESGTLSAGFSAVSITPDIHDTWTDIDDNARYEPDKGDTFTDGNGNDKFDPVWIAGFQNRRAANGIHDSLWARTMVIDNGQVRVALVSIDAIGLFHDEVVNVRKRLSEELNIDYCMVASTHVHEAPDIMGIWGESMFKSGVDENYLESVVDGIVTSVEKAVSSLEPVSLHFSKNESEAQFLVNDTREPIVHDPGMYIIEAKRNDGTTKGVMVSWANHPETVWSKNLLITSDFPHYFREELEAKTGGTCVYMNGAIGGLITTHPKLEIIHPETGEKFKEATFEKVEAQGKILADIAFKTMNGSMHSLSESNINVVANTFKLPFKNKLYRLGAIIGVIDRGMTGWWKVRTEMAAIQIGSATILTIPGEIYPEIVNGGVESPEGADFPNVKNEIPPLREMMPGDYKFVIGMANDELGYFIPKSQWDNEEPWTYGDKELYGEENSLGPETTPIIQTKAKEILSKLN